MPEQREALKQAFIRAGAKITADAPDGLYISLRNTHVEIHEFGGVIDGTYRTANDWRDFNAANIAVAKVFLEAAEAEQFKQWIRSAASPRAPSPQRADYQRIEVTFSRAPLRVVFAPKQQSLGDE